jgi:hypothetical protein
MFLQKLAVVWAKNDNIFAKFFGENISKMFRTHLFAQDVKNVSITKRPSLAQAVLELRATPEINFLRPDLRTQSYDREIPLWRLKYNLIRTLRMNIPNIKYFLSFISGSFLQLSVKNHLFYKDSSDNKDSKSSYSNFQKVLKSLIRISRIIPFLVKNSINHKTKKL